MSGTLSTVMAGGGIMVASAAPSPPFSNRVQQHLQDRRIHEVWRKIVNESACFYLAEYPGISDKSEYHATGMKMVEHFPHTAHDGTEKWVRQLGLLTISGVN
jgi:hypothetical protein